MKKKVLFVINTLGHAGAEVAMLELFRYLNPEQYAVSLYVIMGQGELVHRLPSHVTLLNQKYNDASVLSKEGRRNMRGTILRALFSGGAIPRKLHYLISGLFGMLKAGKIHPDKLLWRILADGAERSEETYDLAVAYLEGGSSYYVADYVKAKKRAAFIHIDYGRAGYTRKLDRDCYLKYDQIFAVSAEVRDSFLLAYPECRENTEIFDNLIDQEGIRRRAKEPGGFTDAFTGQRILTVGRLTYQKAYEIAIDAMKLLKAGGYPLRWYVLGEGNERGMLENKIAELGLSEDFVLLGAVENPYPYYLQTDIYVHATRFEGKSIAIQEAQTLGCAILASDCSGNREQITDGVDGLLCELSAQAIHDGIVELITNDEKRRNFRIASAAKELTHKEDLQMLFALMESEK